MGTYHVCVNYVEYGPYARARKIFLPCLPPGGGRCPQRGRMRGGEGARYNF